MYVEGDLPLSLGNGNCNNGGGMFGNDGFWAGIIGLIAVAAIFGGGWGNGGGLFGGRGGNGGNEMLGYQLGGLATQADIAAGFNNSAVLSSLNDLKLGQQTGFANVQQTLCQGFGGVNTALVQQGYETRIGLNGLSNQLAQCCCDLRAGQADIKYTMAKDTCDTINAINGAKQDIIGFLTQQELASLRNENQALKFAASQSAQNAFISATSEAQTAELIRRFGLDRATCPIPAYVVPNPNCCYGNPYGVGYNNSCGCNNGVGVSVQ